MDESSELALYDEQDEDALDNLTDAVVLVEQPQTWPDWWHDEREFDLRVQKYLSEAAEKRLPLTGSGIASVIGLERSEFAYMMRNEKIRQSLPKKIKQIVSKFEKILEEMLIVKNGSTQGIIFLAKQYGYKEENTVNINHQTMGTTLANVLEGKIAE